MWALFPAARRALLAVRTKGPLWAESWRCGQQAQRVPPPEPGGLRRCWGWTPGPSSQAVLKSPQGPFQEMDVPGHTVLGAACSSCSSQSCLPSSISSLAREPRICRACCPSHPLNRALISLGQELGAWPAEEKPMSLLGAPSLSGLGQAGLQMIQLP